MNRRDLIKTACLGISYAGLSRVIPIDNLKEVEAPYERAVFKTVNDEVLCEVRLHWKEYTRSKRVYHGEGDVLDDGCICYMELHMKDFDGKMFKVRRPSTLDGYFVSFPDSISVDDLKVWHAPHGNVSIE